MNVLTIIAMRIKQIIDIHKKMYIHFYIVSQARRKDQLFFKYSETRDMHQLCAGKAS